MMYIVPRHLAEGIFVLSDIVADPDHVKKCLFLVRNASWNFQFSFETDQHFKSWNFLHDIYLFFVVFGCLFCCPWSGSTTPLVANWSPPSEISQQIVFIFITVPCLRFMLQIHICVCTALEHWKPCLGLRLTPPSKRPFSTGKNCLNVFCNFLIFLLYVNWYFYKSINCVHQCWESPLVSMRIRIQHFRSVRILIHIFLDQGVWWPEIVKLSELFFL
jgi:hypothetical protein